MAVENAAPSPLDRDAAAGGIDWDALYADQLPRIYNYFRFRLGGDPDAEDLTARTFEKAWRKRAAYRRDRAAFETWLFRIAHNVAIDHLRSRRPHAPLDEALDVHAEGAPEGDAEHSSDLARLAVLAARLSERERDLIALKYGAELTNRFIARLTGLSESNVGTIVHRAVQTLRAQW
jgi:RNA polymerase sigma-70 factor, ECF subfamily